MDIQEKETEREKEETENMIISFKDSMRIVCCTNLRLMKLKESGGFEKISNANFGAGGSPVKMSLTKKQKFLGNFNVYY